VPESGVLSGMIVAQALGSEGMRADEAHSVHRQIFNEDATASITCFGVLQLCQCVVRTGSISMSPADLAKKHHACRPIRKVVGLAVSFGASQRRPYRFINV
jgi:hypothetical protein